MAEVYIATEDAVVTVGNGDFVAIRRDITRVAEGHPLLKSHGQFFKPASEGVHFDVEDTRATPKAGLKKAAPKADKA